MENRIHKFVSGNLPIKKNKEDQRMENENIRRRLMDNVGVVFGRFQPFHNGHLQHVLIPFDECDFVYIGITNPDRRLIGFDESDPNRSMKSSNPFSYFHRMEMIKRTLLNQKISFNRFEVIPFPINFPDLILNYSPKNAVYYIPLLTNDDSNDWNLKKQQILTNLNLKTKLIENKRITSASEVRKLMRDGDNWEELVPKAVCDYIYENGLKIGDERN